MNQQAASVSAPFTNINQDLQRLLDENAILNLIARFDDAILRQDADAFRELWTQDGVWEIGHHNPAQSKQITPLHAQGTDELLAAQAQFIKMNEFFFRTTLRAVIMIEGERATARMPTTELARRDDGSGYNNVAMYEDELVRSEGRWLFAARRYFYIWVDSTTPVHGGDTVPLPETLRRGI